VNPQLVSNGQEDETGECRRGESQASRPILRARKTDRQGNRTPDETKKEVRELEAQVRAAASRFQDVLRCSTAAADLNSVLLSNLQEAAMELRACQEISESTLGSTR
jgi:hypothetical protein